MRAYSMQGDDGVTHTYTHMPRGSPIHTEALSMARLHPSSPIPYVAAAECREGVELAAAAEWRTSLPSSTESRRGESYVSPSVPHQDQNKDPLAPPPSAILSLAARPCADSTNPTVRRFPGPKPELEKFPSAVRHGRQLPLPPYKLGQG